MTKAELAVENFKNGYNCSQAVAAAFCEDFGMSRADCLRISEGFGGGMGRMRSVCGAVSGMFMLAGRKHSKAEPKDLETRKLIYRLVQDMAEDFKAQFGTIICAELLGGIKTAPGAESTLRDSKFYQERPCLRCVALAAEIAEKYLYDD